MDTIQFMSLGILALFLQVSMLLYLRLARKFSIQDVPNARSSHSGVIPRGGGIVFLLAALIWGVTYPKASPFFLAGISLVGLVGFWDDLKSLSWSFRMLAQLISILLLFMGLEILQFSVPFIEHHWWKLLILLIMGVGVLNAYNFMDGINGMIGLGSVVVLSSLMYVNYAVYPFVQDQLILYPLIAALIFLIFNFRKRALCFSGDVGAMVVAYWTFFLIVYLCLQTGSWVWFGFILLFGVDTGLTILHRLVLRQKLWEAHRLHLYQVLSNEMKVPQLAVSSLYAVLQLLMNLVIIQYWYRYSWWMILALLFVPLAIIYAYKFRFLKRHSN